MMPWKSLNCPFASVVPPTTSGWVVTGAKVASMVASATSVPSM